MQLPRRVEALEVVLMLTAPVFAEEWRGPDHEVLLRHVLDRVELLIREKYSARAKGVRLRDPALFPHMPDQVPSGLEPSDSDHRACRKLKRCCQNVALPMKHQNAPLLRL